MKKYRGQKKLLILKEYPTIGVLPLKVLYDQMIIVKRSKEADFNFIKWSLTENEVPDYHGFYTRNLRNTQQSTKPKTYIRYRLMINKTLVDPSTILTAMVDVETIS